MRFSVFVIACLFALNLNAYCFDEVGSRFDVNPDLLKAIAFTESSMRPDAINHNRNSKGEIVSTDYGLMQINSSWFSRFATMGITESAIRNEPCTNVLAGAWILAMNFQTSGETWRSVGAYNAGYRASTEASRQKYITIVKENLDRINDV